MIIDGVTIDPDHSFFLQVQLKMINLLDSFFIIGGQYSIESHKQKCIPLV